MSFMNIRDIQAGQNGMQIKVRVCRMWRGRVLKPVEQPDGFHIVLVDEHNDAIHAMVKGADYDDVSGNVAEGLVYEIINFYSRESQKQHKVVPHLTQLVFNNHTVFKLLPDIYPPLPQHRFYFVEYNNLLNRLNNDTILTDVIGRLRIVQPSEDVPINGRVTSRRHIHIQNTSKEMTRITLWGEMAEKFDADAINGLTSPVVIVFTSVKVRMFQSKVVLNGGMNTCVFIDPKIPETADYKACFAQSCSAPTIKSPSLKLTMDAGDVKAAKKVKVGDLNLLTPTNDKDTISLCRAKITKIIFRDGWYYIGCPSCNKQMVKPSDSGSLMCKDHGHQVGLPLYRMQLRLEDNTDSIPVMLIGRSGDSLFETTCEKLVNELGQNDKYNLPSVVENKMKKYFVWKIGYGTRDDLMVKAVYPDCGETTGYVEEGLSLKSDVKIAENAEKGTDGNVVPKMETPQKQKPAKRCLQKEKTWSQMMEAIFAKRLKRDKGKKDKGKAKEE